VTRFFGGAAVVVALLLVVLSVTGLDVSALRDFEHDVTVMQNPLPDGERYFDPSGHSIWLPSDLHVWDSVRHGELPLWERLQGGGYSSVNAMHEGIFHPLRWIVAAVPRLTAPSALIALILATAFIGMYALARFEFGFSIVAASLAAFAFAFSSVLISTIHFSGGVLPLAHIPWIVFFLRRPGRAGIAGAAIVIALVFLSGHPLLETCAVATAGAVALADTVVRRSARPVLRYCGAAAAGFLIAAPAWLPAALSWSDLWTYKTQTERGASYFAYGILEWTGAVQAMFVDLFDPNGCCIDLGAFFLYVGIAAIALVVIGAIFERRLRAFVVLAAAAFLIAVPGPWMQPFVTLRPLSFFKPWYLSGALAFFLAILIGAGVDVLWRGGVPRRVIGSALAIVIVITYLIRADTVLRPRILHGPPDGPAVGFLKNDRDRFRVVGLWGQTHMPNASRITGIEDLRLSGPILTLRYHLWWLLVDPDVLTRGYPTTRVTDHLASPLVGDFNVKYVIESRLLPVGTFRLDRNERDLDRGLSPLIATFPMVFRNHWVEVFRNPHGYEPRAEFVATAAVAADMNDAARQLVRGAPVVVESDHPIPSSRGGTVAVSYPAGSRVRIDAHSGSGGLVVLHDSFAEGWVATIDGNVAPVLPVNILSRGVVVPAGSHRIEMTYRPKTFTTSLAVSAAAILALILALRRLRAVESRTEDAR